jgi:hypothetical protein
MIILSVCVSVATPLPIFLFLAYHVFTVRGPVLCCDRVKLLLFQSNGVVKRYILLTHPVIYWAPYKFDEIQVWVIGRKTEDKMTESYQKPVNFMSCTEICSFFSSHTVPVSVL